MQEGVGLLVSDMMPIYMIIALDIIMIIRFSINCLTVICLPIVSYLFSLFSYHIKPKIPFCIFPLFILFCVLVRSIYQILYNLTLLVTVAGLTTPLRVGLQVFVVCVQVLFT